MGYWDGFIVLNSQHLQDETKFCGRGHLIIHFSENKKNQCSFKALSSSKNLFVEQKWCWGKKMHEEAGGSSSFFFFIVEALSDCHLVGNKEAKHSRDLPASVLRSPKTS